MTTLSRTMHVRDLLSGLSPDEDPEEVRRRLDLENNPTLESIMKGFATFLEEDSFFTAQTEDSRFYELSLELAPASVSAEDITLFSIYASTFASANEFYGKLGLYLSALINRSQDETITVHTSHLEEGVRNLGYKNTEKNIVVEGSVDNYVGCYMTGGNILVKGNAKSPGEDLRGGNIIISGDTVGIVGWRMSGGSVLVQGNARGIGLMEDGLIRVLGNASAAGHRMNGGLVIVEGLVEELGKEMYGGTVIAYGGANKVAFGMEDGYLFLSGPYQELAPPDQIKGGSVFHDCNRLIRKGNIL